MNPKYDELKRAGRALGETNDCSVVSWSVVTGDDYAVAHNKVSRLALRPQGNGPKWGNLIAAYLHDGWRLENVTAEVRGRGGKTVTSIGRLGLPGRHLVVVGNGSHVLGVRDGEVIDWSEGRRHRACQVWRVVKGEPHVSYGSYFGQAYKMHGLAAQRLKQLKEEQA